MRFKVLPTQTSLVINDFVLITHDSTGTKTSSPQPTSPPAEDFADFWGLGRTECCTQGTAALDLNTVY